MNEVFVLNCDRGGGKMKFVVKKMVGDVVVVKIESANNLADSFTKALPQRTFESHLEGMGVKLVHNSL